MGRETLNLKAHFGEVFWILSDKRKLTLNQEEEAQDPSAGDDDSGDDEG